MDTGERGQSYVDSRVYIVHNLLYETGDEAKVFIMFRIIL